ncbi:MAG: protease modulator HflC [Symbiobacteriia bacterium]
MRTGIQKLALGLGALLLVVVVWNLFTFRVDQSEQAVVLQFGQVVRVVQTPGLNFKAPFTQRVQRYTRRVMTYDTRPTDVVLRDKKPLSVDNYVAWRIVDPVKFLKTVQNAIGGQNRLDDIVYSELRVALGQYDMHQIITTDRSLDSVRNQIMADVTSRTNEMAQAYGIEVLDVRIKKVDPPPQNLAAIYDRMKSERNREASQYRSEGQEQAAMINAETAKTVELLGADAYKKAQESRGKGDAEAMRIYNQALGQDPEFYQFIQTLDTYRTAFRPGTRFILTPDSPLLKYLEGR